MVLARIEQHGLDEARFRMQAHIDDLAFRAAHAEALADAAQQPGIQAGIEVIGIVGLALALLPEPVGPGHHRFQAEFIQRGSLRPAGGRAPSNDGTAQPRYLP
jgi:hypothetical protein